MLFHIAFHQPAISKCNIGDRDDVIKNHKNLITSFDCKQMGPSRVGNCACTAGTLGPKGDRHGTSPQNNVMLLGFCHLTNSLLIMGRKRRPEELKNLQFLFCKGFERYQHC